MVKRVLKIVWDEEAVKSLKEIFYFIYKDSPIADKKVKNKIVAIAKSLQKFPEKYSNEFYIEDKKYRSITVWSYKIIYRVTEKEIRIVMIFHTSRNPTEIQK